MNISLEVESQNSWEVQFMNSHIMIQVFSFVIDYWIQIQAQVCKDPWSPPEHNNLLESTA